MGPGPSDRQFRVRDAVDKRPYDPPRWMPPWRGPLAPPALPGPRGGFAHFPVESRQFMQAHLFGCARLALNVWTAYLGEPIRFLAEQEYPVLELVPLVDWPNAQSGPGFLETGAMENDQGELNLFCLNLDVIAHEIGHTVVFAVLGVPEPGHLTAQFLAFHECMADLTTLLAALQFDSVLDRVLEESGGNLYALNEINRIAELSSTQQIRIADNRIRMADVSGIHLAQDGTWRDESGLSRNAHALAEPLTGALFDTFVTFFQTGLVERGVIAPDDDPNGWTEDEIRGSLERLRAVHRDALARRGVAFREALLQARDELGLCLAEALTLVPPDDFSFDGYASVLLGVCRKQRGPAAARSLDEALRWRGIVPRRLPAAAAQPQDIRIRAGLSGSRPPACCRRHRSGGSGHFELAMALGDAVRRDHRAAGQGKT